MIPHRAHVFGLGVTGRATVDWLLRNGWMVIATDDNVSPALEITAQELKAFGAEILLGGHRGALEKHVDLVVLSPGIAPSTPAIQERIRQGSEVIGEVELGWRNSRGTFAAITGANGKSTTTALTGKIFELSGRKSFTVGNIGIPLIEIADSTDEDSLIALEISSYQLETIVGFRPKVAALLNITPDHLERHGDLEGYCRAKARVWKNQESEDFIVFNADDPLVVERLPEAKSQKVPFSLAGPLTFGGWLEKGQFTFRFPDGSSLLIARGEASLPGKHNEANILAAVLIAKLSGVENSAIVEGVRSFKGLSHRLEPVRELNGVKYVNDSKATNTDAGRWALMATEAPVILLAGGRPKKGGFKPIRDAIEGKVKLLIVFGEASDEILQDLGDLLPVVKRETMAEALELAKSEAYPGDTILLSPLCASFDQFRSFVHRGDVFKELVKNLK